MSFGNAIKTCLVEKYCCFSGRASRSEYWFYCLFNCIVSFAVSLICGLLFGSNSIITSIITGIVTLALLLPGLGASVRRMHDVGRSGWYLLMALIPIAGPIIVLVKECSGSQPGDNQYGPNPKA